MKIVFTKNYKVKAAGGPEYKEGQVVDLPEPSARHFLDRKRAEIFKGEAPAKAPEVKPEEAEVPEAPKPEEKDPPKEPKPVKARPLGTAKRGRASKQAPANAFDQARKDAGTDE